MSDGEHETPSARAAACARAHGVRCDLPDGPVDLVPEADGAHVLLAEGAEKVQAGRPDRVGPGNLVVLLPGARLDRCSLHLRGAGHLVVIGPGARLKQVHVQVGGRRNTVVIGARTTWESGTLMCGGWHGCPPVDVVVGADCMLSNGVILRTTDSHGLFDAATRERLNDPASVVVAEHVWLGSGARAAKGSRIGANVVVGQLSLVTGTLQPGGLYAGVPARLLRAGVTWSRSTSWDDIPEQYVDGPPVGGASPDG